MKVRMATTNWRCSWVTVSVPSFPAHKELLDFAVGHSIHEHPKFSGGKGQSRRCHFHAAAFVDVITSAFFGSP